VVDERGDARSIERLVAHAAVVVSGETAGRGAEARLVGDEAAGDGVEVRLVAHAAVVVSGETAGRGAEARRAGDEAAGDGEEVRRAPSIARDGTAEAERTDGEGGDRRGEPVRSWRETACSYRKRVRSSRETLRSCREAVGSLSEDRPGWHQEDETAGQAVTNASTTALVTGSGHR